MATGVKAELILSQEFPPVLSYILRGPKLKPSSTTFLGHKLIRSKQTGHELVSIWYVSINSKGLSYYNIILAHTNADFTHRVIHRDTL